MDTSDLGALDSEVRRAFSGLPALTFERARLMLDDSARVVEPPVAIAVGRAAAVSCLARALGVAAPDLFAGGSIDPSVARLLADLEAAFFRWPTPSQEAIEVARSIIDDGRKDLALKLGLVIAELMVLRCAATEAVARASR
jgi:hypothetical protein